MLNIFLKGVPNIDVITYNDAWFGNNLSQIKFEGKVIDLIEQIEHTKYYKDYQFAGKFDGGSWIHVSNMSTGCKTAINVFTFKDKIFNAIECGPNALGEICKLTDGNVYIPCFLAMTDFTNKICVNTPKQKWCVNNNLELFKLLQQYYIRR